jgi:hypothetical protein
MIGQKIVAQPGAPVGSFILLILGLVLLVLAVVLRSLHPVAGAMPFLIWGGMSWAARGQPFAMTLTEEGIEVEEEREVIRYTDFEGLAARRPLNPYKKGPRRYPITVLHKDGRLLIPARLNVECDDLYIFLFRRFPNSNRQRKVPTLLADYLRYEERRCGAEHVWVYRARRQFVWGGSPGFRRFLAGMVLTCVAWMIVGFGGEAVEKHMEVWGFLGIPFLLIGSLGWLAVRLQGRPQGVRNPQDACLIVCPEGFALVQGDLQGQMRWDELKDVKLQTGYVSGLMLKVAGASFLLADIYDRPLGMIYQQICYYWKGEKDRESFDRDLREAAAARGRKAGREDIRAE